MSDRRCHPFNFEGSLEEFDRREAEAATRVHVSIAAIRKGDTFVHEGRPCWTALSDARAEGDDIAIDVQHAPDGGCATRLWPRNTQIVLPIER